MDYIFHFQKGVDNIHFNYSEQKVISILGEPDNIERSANKGKLCNDIDLSYKRLGISIMYTIFYLPDPNTDYYSDEIESIDMIICLNRKFVFEGIDWFELDKKQIIKIVRELYSRYKIKYICDYEKTEFEDFTSEQYTFDEIGLDITFNDGHLRRIFVQKPEEELILPEPKKKPKTYQLEPLETNLQMVSEPKTEYKYTQKKSH